MRKNRAIVMLIMILAVVMSGTVYASTHTGSSQWKNKTYTVVFTGSYSKTQFNGTMSSAGTTMWNTSNTYCSGLVSVNCYKYATATLIDGSSKTEALDTGDNVGVIMARVPSNSNYKYEHGATLRVYNMGPIIDSYSYTAWQDV